MFAVSSLYAMGEASLGPRSVAVICVRYVRSLRRLDPRGADDIVSCSKDASLQSNPRTKAASPRKSDGTDPGASIEFGSQVHFAEHLSLSVSSGCGNVQ